MKSLFVSYSDFLKYFKLEKKLINFNQNYNKISKGSIKNKNIIWSKLLFNDLIYCKLFEGKLFQNSNYQGSSLNLFLKKNINIYSTFLFNNLKKKKYFDKFSYHFDFSRKVFLYKKLKKLNRRSKLLFPECGLLGFDMIIAHKLVFKNIEGYDVDKTCKNSVNKIWGTNLKIKIINTKNLKIPNNEYLIIKPDWPSIYFDNKFKDEKNTLEYSNKYDFGSHINKLKMDDFIDFIRKF